MDKTACRKLYIFSKDIKEDKSMKGHAVFLDANIAKMSSYSKVIYKL